MKVFKFSINCFTNCTNLI